MKNALIVLACIFVAACSSVKESTKTEETVTITEREIFVPLPASEEQIVLVPVEPPEHLDDLPAFLDVPILVADEPATDARPRVRATVTRNRTTGQHRLELRIDSSTVAVKIADTTRTIKTTIEREYQPPWYERVWNWIQDKVFWITLTLIAVVFAAGLWRKMAK